MTEIVDTRCALWYWTYGCASYQIFDDENQAVDAAIDISHRGAGSISGVQFADGRLLDTEHWAALRAEEKRRMAVWQAEFEQLKKMPRPKTRTVYEPFDSQHAEPWQRASSEVKVPVDEPQWLGVPKS